MGVLKEFFTKLGKACWVGEMMMSTGRRKPPRLDQPPILSAQFPQSNFCLLSLWQESTKCASSLLTILTRNPAWKCSATIKVSGGGRALGSCLALSTYPLIFPLGMTANIIANMLSATVWWHSAFPPVQMGGNSNSVDPNTLLFRGSTPFLFRIYPIPFQNIVVRFPALQIKCEACEFVCLKLRAL